MNEFVCDKLSSNLVIIGRRRIGVPAGVFCVWSSLPMASAAYLVGGQGNDSRIISCKGEPTRSADCKPLDEAVQVCGIGFKLRAGRRAACGE